jgi:hypothetical protein
VTCTKVLTALLWRLSELCGEISVGRHFQMVSSVYSSISCGIGSRRPVVRCVARGRFEDAGGATLVNWPSKLDLEIKEAREYKFIEWEIFQASRIDNKSHSLALRD